MGKSAWGSISKRGDAWRIRWPKGTDADGKRVYGSKTVHGTKKDARTELDRIHLAIEHGSKTTVGGFWEQVYLPEITECLAPSTVHGYEKDYLNHVEPAFGSREMSSLKGKEIQAWLDTMSYGAARHAKAMLSAMLGRAHAMDYIDSNVMARRYRLPQKDARERAHDKTIGSASELDRIASLARGQRWEPAFLAAAFAGLRRSEAFALRPSCVRAVEQGGCVYAALLVDTTAQVVGGELSVRSVLKTEHATGIEQRWAVMSPPWASRMLTLAAEADAKGWAWLCDNGAGELSSPDRLTAAYKRWFATIGEVYVPFRNLRNSYTTNMHNAGMELENIAKLLGHTTDSITYRHYDRPDVEDLIERVSRAMA